MSQEIMEEHKVREPAQQLFRMSVLLTVIASKLLARVCGVVVVTLVQGVTQPR